MLANRLDSYRAALLVIGAPTPRYHRQRGSFPRRDRMEAMNRRVRFIDKAASFTVTYFGDIANHGSFLHDWMDGYEQWYTQCVSKMEDV